MVIFCHKCGDKIYSGATFCEKCGTKVQSNSDAEIVNTRKSLLGTHPPAHNVAVCKIQTGKLLKKLGTLLLVLFLAGITLLIIDLYQSYQQTQSTIIKLSDIASFTNQKLTDQKRELDSKTNQIAKLEEDLKSTSNPDVASSNIGINVLSSMAPAVVKIVCYSDVYMQDLQIGSGVLYHSDSGDPSTYFIETNRHVVQTSDGSPSRCVIAVYPNYEYTYSYLLYKTEGYKNYKYGVDHAFLIPKIANSENAGTVDDLKKYAKDLTANTYCKSTSIGDHVSILGYPGVGGSSLTATDGIISGFEYDSGSRFIKTSAKIEHGNSGGVAIKDSGCVIGIPTFVETGSVESIGRILDLNDLFNG